MLYKLKTDIDETQRYDEGKFREYIVRDFERRRVFVDIKTFMERVLHVPGDWRKAWRRTIRRTKSDTDFSAVRRAYTRHCTNKDFLEEDLYGPLVAMTNYISKLSKPSSIGSEITRTQCYLRNDRCGILGGVTNVLMPDIVAIHARFLPKLNSEERKENSSNERI